VTAAIVMHIVVRGTPVPQGSKRAFQPRRKDGSPAGKPRVIEQTHDRLRSWRQDVLGAALEATEQGTVPPLAGPLCMAVTFTLRRPQNHFRTGRNAALLREQAPPWPAGTPDSSKLLRAVEDALADAGVYLDDAQIVEHCRVAKCYPPVPWTTAGTWKLAGLHPRAVAGIEGADAMPAPGAIIRIAPMRKG
jgi:Holliday junction resolvase RusA-like endonuclease